MRTRWIGIVVVGSALAALGLGSDFLRETAESPAQKADSPAPTLGGAMRDEPRAVSSSAGEEKQTVEEKTSTVLDEDFSHKAVVEWSHSRNSQTPRNKKSFLGELGPEVVTLVLRELPPHKLVRISFDLYVIRSWDGSNEYWGPDIWQLSLFNGPALVRTTFNNCGRVGSTYQAYPDNYPCPPHDSWTGAKEKETLGYEFDFRNFGGSVLPCDSVYHIEAVAPHREAKVAFQFAAFYNDHCATCAPESKDQVLADQSWGIANLKVQTVESFDKLSPAELQENWDKLASNDAVEAVRSMWRLVAAGDEATYFISKALHLGEASQEFNAWQVRRGKRALEIINSSTSRRALWQLAEPGKYETRDEQFSAWELHP